jgi:hypothetical protein
MLSNDEYIKAVQQQRRHSNRTSDLLMALVVAMLLAAIVGIVGGSLSAIYSLPLEPARSSGAGPTPR